jgi:hypothetical protein
VSYDKGATFRRRALQGCEQSAGIKILINSVYGASLCPPLKQIVIKNAVKRKKNELMKRIANVVVPVVAAV